MKISRKEMERKTGKGIQEGRERRRKGKVRGGREREVEMWESSKWREERRGIQEKKKRKKELKWI